MDQLPPLGTAIQDVVVPTYKIYEPLLLQQADKIRSVQKETHAFGSLERQQLDVYSPPKPTTTNGRRPVLMFSYGGGLVNGDKTRPGIGGLVHANVAAFFALNFGYTVVVADYRLLSHGAKFPSGGEDLALAVEWICEKQPGPGSEPIDLFMMGNSAGGIHLSTFLFHPQFETTRKRVLKGHGTRLRGAVLLAVPFHFAKSEFNAKVLEQYFVDPEANCPLSLLQQAHTKQKVLDFVRAGTRVMVLTGELDPEDLILEPRDDFVKAWLQMTDNDSRAALAVDTMTGQNHISPIPSLSCGQEADEAWGFQVAAFCDATRKFGLRC